MARSRVLWATLWVVVRGAEPPPLAFLGACATVRGSASSAVLLVADGRPVHACERGALRCAVSLQPGLRDVSAYELRADGALTLTARARAEASGRACAAHGAGVERSAGGAQGSGPSVVGGAQGSGPSVGVLYEGWHAPPATALANVTARGGTALSVEDVLRSRGALALADIYDKYPGTRTLAAGFFYQATPAAGVYCIYRARAGEAGVLPDCPGIASTLARHAAELSGSGIDYVTLDGTNLGSMSPFADAIQLRPGEVVFEEWAALRARGVPTPAVAAWQTVPTGGDLWSAWLDLYNNATFAPLVHRDANGKKVFFVPPGGDAAIIAAIESNGGRDDVVTQQMWAINSLESDGQWSFFAPCTERGEYTTSVVGLGRGALGCAQRATNASGPLARISGSQIAVSPSYQLGYGSIAFEGANKYDGLTFKRQFATVIAGAAHGWATGARAALPGHVYVSSYNEWTSQPQANPFPAPWTHSLGLADDPQGGDLWVDSYGASVSRDIEASKEAGSGVFDIMRSCLRVVRLAAALDAAVFAGEAAAGSEAAAQAAPPPLGPAVASLWGGARAPALAALRIAFGTGAAGLAACNVAGEACCAYNDTADAYAPVWALRLLPAADALLTADAAEAARLAASGWNQTCNGYDGPTDFCVSRAVANSAAAQHGPFVLHAGACGLAGRAPLYRCYHAADAHHFVSRDARCEGAAVEGALGCVALARTSNMARTLRACTDAAGGMRYHVLDGACGAGDADGGELGYVR